MDAYLDHPIILVDQPDQIQSRAKAKHNAFLTEWQEAALRGDSFSAQQGLLLLYDEVHAALKRHAVLLLSDLRRGLGQFEPTEALQFPSEPIMPYNGRLEPLAKDIHTWREQGCSVVLLTGGEARGQRLLRALRTAERNAATYVRKPPARPLRTGRSAPAAGFRTQGFPQRSRRALRRSPTAICTVRPTSAR